MARINNVAVRIPGFPGQVRLPSNTLVPESKAKAQGFDVVELAAVETVAAQATKDARAEAFASLPEARGKVRSAMRLAADNPDMTPAQARGFLRGAPTDAAVTAQRQAPQRTTAPTVAPTEAERREARKAELRAVAKAHMGRR